MRSPIRSTSLGSSLSFFFSSSSHPPRLVVVWGSIRQGVDLKIREYQALRAALRGAAGGKNSKKRKQNENGGGQLATALTSFLKDWSEKRPEPKSFRKQRDDSELAKSLIQILKNCLNKGSNEIGKRPKKRECHTMRHRQIAKCLPPGKALTEKTGDTKEIFHTRHPIWSHGPNPVRHMSGPTEKTCQSARPNLMSPNGLRVLN